MILSHVFLGLLEERDRHGYDLKHAYDQRFADVRTLQFGQVYRTLSQLVRDGLVAVVAIETEAGPERKRYAITEAGVTDLERWLHQPEEPQPHLQAVLFTKVVLASMSGRSAEPFLDAQRQRHLARMHELTVARRGAAPPEAALADYRLFHVEADLRWIDHVAGQLDQFAGASG